MRPQREGGRLVRSLRSAAGLATVGLTLALSVAIGVGLGIWLDRKFHTNGLAVVAFSLVGVVAGFQQLIQAVTRAGKEQDRIDREDRENRQD